MFIRPLLLVCILAAPLLRAADSEMLDLLLPGSKSVLGVNVRALVQSPLVRQIASEMKSKGPDWTQVVQTVGFDPLQAVDEVVVCSTGESENAPTLIVARGRFGALSSLAGAQNYHGVPVITADGKQRSVFAILGESLAIAGEVPVVRAAIDRRGRAAASPLPLVERITRLSAKYDVYAFGRVPVAALPPAGTKNAAADAVKAIDQFEVGISLSRGLELTADLRARTAKDAQTMSQAIALFGMMVGQQKGAEELKNNLDVRMNGNTLHVGLHVPQEAIARAMAARMSAGRSPVAAAAVAAPVSAPKRAEPPSRVPEGAALVITGADSDGGTIVIPNH